MGVSNFKGLLLCVFFWVCLGGDVAMAASEDSSGRKLDQTPTWAVAVVCTFFILISLTLEKSLHKVGTWLGDKQKRALIEALEKVKAELMILGFISLLLTFGQNYIVKICIPSKVADNMLPCPLVSTDDASSSGKEHRRKLLAEDTSSSSQCKECRHHAAWETKGRLKALYEMITFSLDQLQIRGWKAWEEETSSHGYEFSNDTSRFRLTHETSFVKAHASSFWTKNLLFFYIGSFFRQFYRSVRKADYQALRNGFINVHLAPGSKFNFQKYIKRSLEDDFKVVVGVSPVLWASFVVFLLLNVNGWHAMIWASIIPVVIILAVGTKLQATLAKMALEITERHAVVQGIPLVQGSDKYFWFGRPQLVLHLIHFALFQYSFGLKNCFHADYKLAIVKVALGIAALCLCSYITLPLYALVTQMGSTMKKSIFDEQTAKAIKNWRMAVKKKGGKSRGKSLTQTLGGGSTIGSTTHTSGPILHRFKTTGHSSVYDDEDETDVEADPSSPSPITSTANLSVRVDNGELHEEENGGVQSVVGKGRTNDEADFSFAQTDPVQRTTT
ncbi:MLO-like protein 10 [Senna tora]|uniref:MLO-like protein n=1 Tax=Senna tora TaxID=362788 RepID=A0A834SX81_9FABA|nr:MLO-like protein 10 [Senna tora]